MARGKFGYLQNNGNSLPNFVVNSKLWILKISPRHVDRRYVLSTKVDAQYDKLDRRRSNKADNTAIVDVYSTMRVRQYVTRVLLHRLYSCVQLLYCILTVSTINVHLFTSPLVGVHRIATGLYVCPLAYLKNKMPKLRQIFYACRLWSGLI